MAPTRSPQAGFALVIALSLMAFVLVLLLSITTFVRVESNAAGTQISKIKAQQNALLGVYVAVGELQRAAGPDQRVTARAEIFDTDPTTLQDDGVANPYWLGVYSAVQTGNETQSLENLRIWATDRTAANRVNWLVSSRVTLDTGAVDPVDTDAVTLNGGNPEDVVTVASFNDNAGASVVVSAGKLDVYDQNGSAAGRYSWWVADENAKFRIDQVKEATVLDGQAFEPRWSLMAPLQSNPSILSELSSFDITDSNQLLKLSRTSSRYSFSLIDSAWEDWAKENANDFTVVSQSLPVDVTQGRLKEDLSVYLGSNASGLNDTDNIVRGAPEDIYYNGRFKTLSSALDYTDDRLPKFGLIKSWYESGMMIDGFSGGTPQKPRPHAVDQHGLHPVIMRTAIYYGLAFDVDALGNVYPVFLIYPKFVLWNPHNVPIAPAKYVVQVRSYTTLNAQTNDGGVDYGARNVSQGFNYRGNLVQGANSFAHFNWANPGNPKGLKRDPGDAYPYLSFVIDNDGFAPGETLYYSARDKHPDSEYVNTDIDYFESNYSSSDFLDHNILTNENEGSFGFFYVVSNQPMIPLPANSGDPVPATADTDILRAAFYFRDTSTPPVGVKEPSLTTKLYSVSDTGTLDLLEFIDLEGETLDSTVVDWEHIASEGWSAQSAYNPLTQEAEFRSLNQIRNDPFLADYIRGHGYFIAPTSTVGSVNKMRLFARHNLAVREKTMVDPLISEVGEGRIYADAIPSRNWFDGAAFPTDIPADGAYAGVLSGGYDTPGGFGLYQNSSNFTQSTVYPLYDSVRSETGLLSLGYLKNVNFSQWSWQPSFAFGNSEAHTHVSRNAVRTTLGGTKYHDLSYLLNESLWDRFFVSTIPQAGGGGLSEAVTLPNLRNRLVANADGTFPDVADLRSSVSGFEKAAANVVVEGGFNVNSTSIDAWRMFLASHLGETVSTEEGTLSNTIDRAPMTSKAYPLLAETAAIDTGSPEIWSALRALSAAEIDLLANAIVTEIKLRGPFLSLADFVNRRLIPNTSDRNADFFGLKGTLQAAIDKVSTVAGSNLNEAFYQGATGLNSGDEPDNTNYSEHERGMPGSETGTRMFGVPGYFSQADILSALGSQMTVRGDTYTVRTYGESLASLTGKIESKVWCEAVVQRIAEPVALGDSIVSPTGAFGRQYKIVSVRWLNESDVL